MNIFATWNAKIKAMSTAQNRVVIYGVTDTSNDPFFVQLNDFLIDNTPVPQKQKGIFFHSLQLLVNSGVSFTRSLEIIGQRTRHPKFKRVIATIVHDMQSSGSSFSKALSKYPAIFANAEVKMVYSGEISGKMEETLENIADQIQKNIQFESNIRSAMVYPIIVFITVILATIAVMLFIVPRFISIFDSLGSDIPFITKILIDASSFIQNYWWALISIVALGGFMFQNWKQSENGKRQWDMLLLNIPVFKGLINDVQTTRIATNFATLLHSGVPVTKGLDILSQIMPNRVVAESLTAIQQKILHGKSLHSAFLDEKYIDPILGEVIEVGEQSGKIAEILEKTGQQYQSEVDVQLKNISTLIEPLIVLFAGVVVIFMATAIMLPIFKMQELFSQV